MKTKPKILKLLVECAEDKAALRARGYEFTQVLELRYPELLSSTVIVKYILTTRQKRQDPVEVLIYKKKCNHVCESELMVPLKEICTGSFQKSRESNLFFSSSRTTFS